MIEKGKDVVLPSVASPRKNKLVIKGKLSLVDFLVILPFVILWIILLLCQVFGGSWWLNLVTFAGFAGVATLFVWPLNFLGKDKLYMYIIRWFRYMIRKQNFVCESGTVNKPVINKPKPIIKNENNATQAQNKSLTDTKTKISPPIVAQQPQQIKK